MPNAQTLGIHVMAITENEQPVLVQLPQQAAQELLDIITSSIRPHAVTLHAFYVGSDHMHVLVEANDEEGAMHSIPMLIDMTVEVIRKYLGHSFKWDQGVHVTLLPPWHIQVLKAFVEAQEKFHETKTLQEELNEIFRPGLIDMPEHISIEEINKEVN